MDREVISRREEPDDDDVYQTVLDHEHQHLRRAARVDDLYRWRDRLVTELARPESAYARAMTASASTATQVPDGMRYSTFLDRWSTIVEETIHRLQHRGTVTDQQTPADLATAILAAVHGGVLLARVTKDGAALRNALRLPFAHLAPSKNEDGED